MTATFRGIERRDRREVAREYVGQKVRTVMSYTPEFIAAGEAAEWQILRNATDALTMLCAHVGLTPRGLQLVWDGPADAAIASGIVPETQRIDLPGLRFRVYESTAVAW